MRTLNTNEVQVISGGFLGPGLIEGLFEAAVVAFGIGVVGAFGLGIASVYAYQYFHKQ